MGESPSTRPLRAARNARRALAWEAIKEYTSGALRVLRSCFEVLPPGSDRLGVLARAATRILADAAREMRRPSDLEQLRRRVTRLNGQIEQKLQAER